MSARTDSRNTTKAEIYASALRRISNYRLKVRALSGDEIAVAMAEVARKTLARFPLRRRKGGR